MFNTRAVAAHLVEIIDKAKRTEDLTQGELALLSNPELDDYISRSVGRAAEYDPPYKAHRDKDADMMRGIYLDQAKLARAEKMRRSTPAGQRAAIV